MGAGKGKTHRASVSQAQTKLGRRIQSREREENKRGSKPRSASISSGSHGEAYAEGVLTMSAQGEILVAGHRSPLDTAVFNAQLREEEVDFVVRVVANTAATPFQPELRLRGKIEEKNGVWHIGGRAVKNYLDLFLGQRVEFEVALANRLFAEETDDPGASTLRPVQF